MRKVVNKHGNWIRNVSKLINSIYKQNMQDYNSQKKVSVFTKFDIEIIDVETWFEKNINLGKLNINFLV